LRRLKKGLHQRPRHPTKSNTSRSDRSPLGWQQSNRCCIGPTSQLQGTRRRQGLKPLPQTNGGTGRPNPKITAHGTTIKLPKRALLVRTQGLMALPQFSGKRLHRDLMAFQSTTD
jgi:hypothetical protein